MATKAADFVRLDIPVALTDSDAYRSTHVDVQLNREQAESMHRIFHGLDQAGARLQNGRRIATNADAFRWLLEEAAGNATERNTDDPKLPTS